jgi:hypothetical protein
MQSCKLTSASNFLSQHSQQIVGISCRTRFLICVKSKFEPCPERRMVRRSNVICMQQLSALEQITLNISSPLLFSPRQVIKKIMHICPHFCDIYKAYRSLVTAAKLFEDIWTRIYPASCEGSSTTNSRCRQINPPYSISQGGCHPFIRRPSLTKSIRNSGISHSAPVALKIVP